MQERCSDYRDFRRTLDVIRINEGSRDERLKLSINGDFRSALAPVLRGTPPNEITGNRKMERSFRSFVIVQSYREKTCVAEHGDTIAARASNGMAETANTRRVCIYIYCHLERDIA